MAAGGRIELADIFRSHGAQYLAAHPLARAQAKAWRAIVACRTEALGGSLAISLLLHPWPHTLMRHLHVHALVAGGALTKEGQWVEGKPGFLFPVKALSAVFCGKFIEALQEARSAGKLGQIDSASNDGWRRLLIALRRHAWVVYAKQPLGGSAQAPEYLSRYATGPPP